MPNPRRPFSTRARHAAAWWALLYLAVALVVTLVLAMTALRSAPTPADAAVDGASEVAGGAPATVVAAPG